MSSVGRAPGKVILLGEHAVVFGQPALAAALPFGVEVEALPATNGGVRFEGAQPPPDERIAPAIQVVAHALGVEHARLRVRTELPIGGGLGSSAAFSVALARALAALQGMDAAPEVIESVALDAERVFHGRASGVDHTTSARGGLLLFWKGEPPRVEPVRAARPIPLVLGLTGKSRSTRAFVTSLADRLERDPDELGPCVERLGALAKGGAVDVESGDLESLGRRFDEAHELLVRCDVSCEPLDEIVAAARQAGALGAKLTGAGGGGAAIALAPDPEPVVAAIRAAGYEARVAIVG